MERINRSNSYSAQADVIRVLAIIGVVLIHAIYPIYSRPDFMGGISWWIALFLNTFSHTAIPLFIMLSGYLVISKPETANQTLIRTTKRLIIPLIVWFVAYAAWDAYFLGYAKSYHELATMLITGSVYHLYFLLILIGLYVLLPTVRLLIKNGMSNISLLIRLSFAVGFLYNFFQYVLFSNVSLFNAVTLWIPFVGYFLLGHIFRTKTWFSPSRLLLMFGLGFAVTFLGGYYNFKLLKEGNDLLWRNGVSYFEESLSPGVFLMSIALFQLVIHNQFVGSFFKKSRLTTLVLQQLARASFAIYLVHFMVINYLDLRRGFAFEYLQSDIMTYFITRTIAILISSFLVGLVISHTPILKKTVGL